MPTDWIVKSIAQRAEDALPSQTVTAGLYLLTGLVGLAVFMSMLAMLLVYAERKVAAHFQCRLGPMRVGWHGTLQSVADALKLLLKEDIVPTDSDHFLHLLAPFLCVMSALLALAVLPLTPLVQLVDVNIGVLYVSAITGFSVLGILLGGWSSNNKWSLLGAMRAGAQVISYELTLTMALLVAVMFSGSLKLSDIVMSQDQGWWIWRAPVVGVVSFVLFLISSTAEINRTPFDLAEGESEIAAGFHTEYSGMKFAFFFLAEFLNMFVVSAMAVTLFLGGWMPLHIGNFTAFNQAADLIPPAIWFILKSGAIIFLLMWVRWTLPRLRVDQLMKLEWKLLLPISFANLLAAAIICKFGFYFFANG